MSRSTVIPQYEAEQEKMRNQQISTEEQNDSAESKKKRLIAYLQCVTMRELEANAAARNQAEIGGKSL